MKQVLIVEDDDDIRDALCALLADEGFDARTACDGTEAYSMLRIETAPSLVLLDLWMPGMNGRDFAARMRQTPIWCDVPIVLLSGDRNGDEIAQSIGAAACVKKPFALDAFLDIVRQNTASA